MNWTNYIKNKMTASFILLALCLLVLLSHYLDRLHTENVKNSISTMYEDRLIVEDYILKMMDNVYQIREILTNNEGNGLKGKDVKVISKDFKTTFAIYSKTRLTAAEKIAAVELISNFRKFEKTIQYNNDVSANHSDVIISSLHKLSEIQLDESKLIMEKVESQYTTIKASSQFAFAIVIVILLVLQVMVFSGGSVIPLFKPNDPSLN